MPSITEADGDRDDPALSLSATAYNVIESQIIRGEIPPGALLSEVSLSQSIGIGRTPVREALQRLVRDRLVRIIPRKGAVVSAIDIDQYLRTLEMRRNLERCIVATVTGSATLKQRLEFLALADEMRDAHAAGDITRAIDADRRFKICETEACSNTFLTAAVRPLHAVARRFYFAQARKPVSQVALSQANLMEKIARGDVYAAQTSSDAFIDAIEAFGLRIRERELRLGGQKRAEEVLLQTCSIDLESRLSIKAYELIESRIVTGQYAANDVLSEARLSQELNLGRTPVREALQRLASHHLVRIVPRLGAFVADFDQYDLSHLIEARRPLESLLCRLAARRATDSERTELASIAEDWLVAACQGGNAKVNSLDQRMKALLIRAAKNEFLADVISPLHALVRALYFKHQTEVDLDVARAQVSVLEAIVAGDESESGFAAVRFIAESARAIRNPTVQGGKRTMGKTWGSHGKP